MSVEREAWDRFSVGYTERVLGVSMFAAWRRRLVSAICPGRVLDLGCGPVSFLLRDLLAVPGLSLIGADFSWPMLTAARHSVRSNRVAFVLADNRELPFADESMATVLAVNSILPEQRADIDVMLSEVRRVLRPGGRFVAVFPAFETSLMARDHWGISIEVDLEDHRERDTTGWQCFYTADDIVGMLRRHGFPTYRLEQVHFTSQEEVSMIQKIYGPVPNETLRGYPLFEHFVVADRGPISRGRDRDEDSRTADRVRSGARQASFEHARPADH